MQIAPFNYVKRSKQFDASKWPLCTSQGTLSIQADLIRFVPQIRDDHIKYISELARYSNEVSFTC
jgi:cytoplasmic FMR1 interacting protein